MKISNVILASMIGASVFVSCKSSPDEKNKLILEKKKMAEKTKKDSLKSAVPYDTQNCPACGMG